LYCQFKCLCLARRSLVSERVQTVLLAIPLAAACLQGAHAPQLLLLQVPVAGASPSVVVQLFDSA
jgi:hypothetical protein